jgi:tetratricopeptide (TPR) repeat protein
VKRTLAAAILLTLGAGWATVAYEEAGQSRAYQALLRSGDTALVDAQTVEAIEAYSGAVTLRPQSMIGHLRRGETYLMRGDLEAASRDFQKAASLDPTATRPQEKLGDLRYLQRRFSRAAEHYDARLQLDDRSAEVTYKLALARYRVGDVGGSRAALERLIRLDDRMPDAYYLLGLCLTETRRWTEAAKAFESAVALGPALVAAREELVSVYGRLGRRQEELANLRFLADLEPDSLARQIALARGYARHGRTELAVLTLRAALERTTDPGVVYADIGKVWFEIAQASGDRTALSKALEALERVAAVPDAPSPALTTYGRALVLARRSEAAERVLLQATQRLPLDPTALLEYADLVERQGRFDAARDALIRYHALNLDPEDAPDTQAARIANLSMRVNEPATAIFWFERAITAQPTNVRLLALLADAQLRSGDRLRAQATIARGLGQDPANETLLALSRR